mgnify:CR=1 FL=1
MGKKIIINRETWLEDAKSEIKTRFKSSGHPFKAKDLKGIKVTTSFPISSKVTKGNGATAPIGQCCYDYNSNTEILISPLLGGKTIDESVQVLQVLTHELVHAYLGAGFGHGAKFKKIATAVGLVGKMTATVAGEDFTKWAKEIIKKIGKFPHEKFDISGKKKQTTRMVKVICDSGIGGCDSKWYASRAQWAKGLGACDVIGCEGKKLLDKSQVEKGQLSQGDYDSIISQAYYVDPTNKKYK